MVDPLIAYAAACMVSVGGIALALRMAKLERQARTLSTLHRPRRASARRH
ncbi:hypothetical protein [Sphingomonas crocodyli]|nr:hypothetical protein [Sphingomonas crocodyli]